MNTTTHTVIVTERNTSGRTLKVSASSPREAAEKAVDKATTYGYSPDLIAVYEGDWMAAPVNAPEPVRFAGRRISAGRWDVVAA